MTTKHTLTPFDVATLAANLAESKKAIDTTVLDTGKVSYLADYFVICTGESAAQIRTIADEIERVLRQQGEVPIGKERDSACKWSLLDYGDVVIHVMHRSEREYYQLENFWSHANEIPAEKWRSEPARQAS